MLEDEARPMIHIRLPKEMIRAIDHLGVDMDLDRARTIEHLLNDVLSAKSSAEARR